MFYPTCCTSAFCGKIDCSNCRNVSELLAWYARQFEIASKNGKTTSEGMNLCVRFTMGGKKWFVYLTPSDSRAVLIGAEHDEKLFFHNRTEALEFIKARVGE
jgi:hypothetical protein